MKQNELSALIDHYRRLGAPEEQQLLIMLLKEVQDLCGGAVSSSAVDEIAEAYHLKSSILLALIRRVPSLHFEDAPHSLEICGTCREGRALAAFIEKTYSVKSGGCSREGGFSYRVTGCMKNCKNGPSIRWDGNLISRAAPELISALIKNSRSE